MKKHWLLTGGLILFAQLSFAQRGQELQGFSKSKYEDALNHSNVTAFLASPEFQMIMTAIIVMAAGAWLFYFWITFQMGQAESETGLITALRQRFFASGKPSVNTYPPLTPDAGERFTRISRLDIRRNTAPLMAAGHENKEKNDRKENRSPHGRGG